MSERMTVEMEIGGPVPVHLVEELINQIKAEGVGLWNESNFDATTARDLIALARDGGQGGTLRLMDHEVAWGQFDTLEAFLVKHHIAFDRWSEAKYEYDAELVQYRPGMRKPRVRTTRQNKEPVVSLCLLRPVQTALEQSRPRRALKLLQDALGPIIPSLEPLQIIKEREVSARLPRKGRKLST